MSDIVARLRDCTCVPHGDICREAADEIERLRAELAAMREQRDEARREWCYMESCVRNEYGMEPTDEPSIAAERGWDCFAQQEGGGA